ncbi:MAG: phytanoyl-CoA dioxygenase family protein [Ilumatobacteraceae bacterium]
MVTATEPLPAPTADLDEARAHLDTWGYCLVKDALSPDEVGALRRRLIEQASGEAAAGLGRFDDGAFVSRHGRVGGPNQRVVNLLNKGEIFQVVPQKPAVQALIEHVLGERFLLSSFSANIAGPGGQAQELHQDQGYVPHPQPVYSCVADVAWFLDDVDEANGGTRVVPGSHRWEERLPLGEWRPSVAGAGPAGTAMVIPGRTYHGTGANVSNRWRHVLLTNFCRVFVRQQENPFLGLAPEVRAALSPAMRRLLGFRVYGSLGGVENGRSYCDEHGYVHVPSRYLRALSADGCPLETNQPNG